MSTIRIPNLGPGKDSEPLEGSFYHHDIHKHPSYEALSYVWGDSRGYEVCHVGKSHGIRITTNLSTALRRLRLPHRSRLLWIDALCINQEDIHERSHQVQLMDEIYRRADNVLIWLGEKTEHSYFGIEALASFSDKTASLSNAPWLQGPPELWKKGIQDVMARPWFFRIWVVQEAVLSRKATIICGTDEMSWTNDPPSVRAFARSIKLAVLSPGWSEIGLADVSLDGFLGLLELQLRQSVAPEKVPPPDILDVAYAMRHRQATDPRDKIFAFLNLAEGRVVKEQLPVGYHKTLQEVFDDFTRVLEGGDLGAVVSTLEESDTGNGDERIHLESGTADSEKYPGGGLEAVTY